MLLELIAIALIVVHFGVPVSYYWYLRKKWLNKPWNLREDPEYRPKVTIIIPTYREAKYIIRKLDNIYQQDYPRDRLEVIVVDSASDDGTPELVKKWAKMHSNIRVILLQEPIRRGMVPALNYALKHVSKDSDIIIFTDADAFWEVDTIKKVTKYFADTSVGAVTTCIAPLNGEKHIEAIYRSYYNVVRIGESKIHSTPVHNGALVAFRKKLLNRIGNLPTYTGNDDSTPASLIAFMGYRAIQINDTIVKEPIRKDQVSRKIRRAQHLVLHFIYTKNYARKCGIYKRTLFNRIWYIELFLHIMNPWLLLIALATLIVSILMGNLISALILALGIIVTCFKQFRVWLVTQLYLMIAIVKNLWNREIMWER